VGPALGNGSERGDGFGRLSEGGFGLFETFEQAGMTTLTARDDSATARAGPFFRAAFDRLAADHASPDRGDRSRMAAQSLGRRGGGDGGRNVVGKRTKRVHASCTGGDGGDQRPT